MSDTDPNTPGTVPLWPLLAMQREHHERTRQTASPPLGGYLWPASGQCACCGARVFRAPPWQGQERRLLDIAGSEPHTCELDPVRLAPGTELYQGGRLCYVTRFGVQQASQG